MKAPVTIYFFFALAAISASVTPQALTAQSIPTVYSVKLPPCYRTKEVLSSAVDDLNVFSRRVNDNGFEFTSVNQLSVEMLYQRFQDLGIPVTTISSSKSSVASASFEKLGGTDCPFAQLLCSGATMSGGAAGFGNQELGPANRGCLATNEHQSSWYYVSILTGGVFTFTITPANGSDDYDFALWGPYTAATAGVNCPPATPPIRCSYTQYPRTGTLLSGCGTNTNPTGLSALSLVTSTDACPDVPFVQSVNVTAGQYYILLVDNFSMGSAYSISFGSGLGAAVLGCSPAILPVELTDFKAVRTTGGNLLRWQTETEHQSESFDVEWSTNPEFEDWISIARVEAAGDSESPLTYNAVHRSPKPNAVNYYRLVQTDTDGTQHIYSDRIAAVDNSGKILNPVKVVNLLGQEVAFETRGIVIYIFEDGTSMKVFH